MMSKYKEFSATEQKSVNEFTASSYFAFAWKLISFHESTHAFVFYYITCRIEWDFWKETRQTVWLLPSSIFNCVLHLSKHLSVNSDLNLLSSFVRQLAKNIIFQSSDHKYLIQYIMQFRSTLGSTIIHAKEILFRITVPTGEFFKIRNNVRS